MVDLANREREDHVMTVEDPIEFLHSHKHGRARCGRVQLVAPNRG
jgi:Tfp pilus assembly pilus retraction ATPase PilT